MATAKRRQATTSRNAMAWMTPLLALLIICLSTPLCAQRQPPPLADQKQAAVIVYVHTVATEVSVAVDSLTIHRTGSVFGVWNYQFNLSSWLDSEPQTVDIKVRFGNKVSAYCTLEVRSVPAGKLAAATVLARKTIHAKEVEKWNMNFTAISLEIAHPPGSVRPLWADHAQVDLKAVARNKSVDLVKEIYDALQGCDLDSLMALIDPALTNQALMEGADPELVKHATLALIRRDCIPRIPVADTMEAFYKSVYQNIMAPLDFEKMVYNFSLDDTREDKRGNLYTPKKPIVYKTEGNREFAARPFLSYTDEKRNRRFVSRFVFERRQ